MENRVIKFEIKLKCIKDKNGHKAGEFVTIINDVFDRQNGIAFWPIDLDFEVVHKRQFTGRTDKNGKEIYNGDLLNGFFYTGIGQPIRGTFEVFYSDVWCSFGIEYEAAFVTIGNCEAEIIGNIYENHNLLTP